jgi:hypothetical protein
MEESEKFDLEFDTYEITDALVTNKNALDPIVESFRMLNKQSVDFKKYERAVASAKNLYASDPARLKVEIEKIEAANIDVREKEMDRIDAINEQLEKKVTVKNVIQIDRKNASGELTIRGKGSRELKYILAIQPFIKRTAINTEEKQPDRKLIKKT